MASQLHIDLRSELPPPRDQGEVRPTCLAFAATAAHEFARRVSSRLCVEYLYFIANGEGPGSHQPAGLTRSAVRVAARERGQPAESVWPYDPNGPTPASPPPNLGPLLRFTLEDHDSPAAVVACIRDRSPAVLAVEITSAWYTVLAPDYVIRRTSGNRDPRGSIAHAVLVIGVRDDNAGDPMLLVQNSWGSRWGDNGCAWLTWSYLNDSFLWASAVGELL